MKKIKKHKKIIIHCALIFMALFFVLRFAKEKYLDQALNTYQTKEITENGNDKQPLTEDMGVVTQEFTATTQDLWGLGLSFKRPRENAQGKIKIEVTDEAGTRLYQATTPVSEIPNSETYWLRFDEIIENSQGKTITLKLQVQDFANGETLAIFADKKASATVGILRDEQGMLEGSIKVAQIYEQSAYLYKMFWLFVGIASLFVYGLYFLLYIKKCSIEVIFLLFMILVGMMYAFLMKPGAIPDEAAHYRTTYAYSNVLLGKSNEVRADVWMDDVDYEFYQTTWTIRPTSTVYRDFQTEFLRRAPRSEMINTKRWPIKAPAYLYAGSIIGMSVGRILGFNGLTVFYLGRFFNVLLFAGLAFWAMKKLPFYKMSLFALCLFPMTAHLIGGFSYDGMILAISLVLVAHIMNMAFGKQEQNQLKEMIIITIASILLGGSKGGAYIPLLCLIFLIPTRYFKDKKQKVIFGGIVAICTMVMFMFTAASSVGSSIGSTVDRASAPPYSIGWIFENPMQFIQLLSNTLAVQGEFLFNSLIGKDLGWFNIPISLVLVLGFLGVFGISCVYVRELPVTPLLKPKQKIGVGLSLLVSVAMIFAGMMFSWTPIGTPYIEGTQGRYFLPLLLPLVFCLKNNNLTLQKSMDRKLIFALVWLHIMVFISVLGVTFVTPV